LKNWYYGCGSLNIDSIEVFLKLIVETYQCSCSCRHSWFLFGFYTTYKKILISVICKYVAMMIYKSVIGSECRAIQGSEELQRWIVWNLIAYMVFQLSSNIPSPFLHSHTLNTPTPDQNLIVIVFIIIATCLTPHNI
jgi:hypothetical protein